MANGRRRNELFEGVGDEDVDVLALVEQQHGAEVADALVGEARRGDQLEALEDAEVGLVAQHVDVEQFGHVAAPPLRVLLADRRPNVRALLQLKKKHRSSVSSSVPSSLLGFTEQPFEDASLPS